MLFQDLYKYFQEQLLTHSYFMFLTNKTKTVGTLKPKSNQNKALGGWDDDESEPSNSTYSKFKDNSNFTLPKPQDKDMSQHYQNVDLLGDEGAAKEDNQIFQFNFKGEKKLEKPNSMTKNKTKQIEKLYSAQQLRSMGKIDCECKVVEEVLALGGIRVKQSDSVLNEFYNEAKGMEISIVGSLLIGYLYSEDASFEIRAKSLYAIEHLCKKSVQYSVYFKLHAEKIKDSPDCQEHQQNYLKIKKNLLGTLGTLVVKPEERRLIEEQLITKEGINFIDPGYNKAEDESVREFINISKKNSQKTDREKQNKKLISPLDAKNKQKKVLQGPGKGKKEKDAEDFNLLGDNQPLVKPQKAQPKPQNSKHQYNLIDMGEVKGQENLLSFEERAEGQTNGQLI